MLDTYITVTLDIICCLRSPRHRNCFYFKLSVFILYLFGKTKILNSIRIIFLEFMEPR